MIIVADITVSGFDFTAKLPQKYKPDVKKKKLTGREDSSQKTENKKRNKSRSSENI